MFKSEDIIPGLPHHIVHRGNNRRRIFSYPVERWAFLRSVALAAAATDCLVNAWCLLDNHVHLIVTPPSVKALSGFVRRWAGNYAKRRNQLRDGSGKLFEQTFFRRALRTDDEAGVATAYVELNSVRAGVVAEPELERWSSATLHLSEPPPLEVPARLWTPSPWFMGLGDSPAQRAAEYRLWLGASEARRRELAATLGRFAKPEPHARYYDRRLRRPDHSSARDSGAEWGTGFGRLSLWSRT